MVAKNLKKTRETVRCVSYLNGEKTGESTESRMVYEKADGSLYINYLGYQKPVKRGPDGVVVVEYHATMIKSTTIDEIMERLREKAGDGPIRIIGLGDH